MTNLGAECPGADAAEGLRHGAGLGVRLLLCRVAVVTGAGRAWKDRMGYSVERVWSPAWRIRGTWPPRAASTTVPLMGSGGLRGASRLVGGRRAHRPPGLCHPLTSDPGASDRAFQWPSDRGQVPLYLCKVPVLTSSAPPGWLEDSTSSHLVPEAPRTRQRSRCHQGDGESWAHCP